MINKRMAGGLFVASKKYLNQVSGHLNAARRPGPDGRGSPRRGPRPGSAPPRCWQPRRVEVAQRPEQAGRGLGQIPRRAQIQGAAAACPAGRAAPNRSTASPGSTCVASRRTRPGARSARRACRAPPAGRVGGVGRGRIRPRTSRSAARVIRPAAAGAARRRGRRPRSNSTPTGVSPPSSIASIRPSRSSRTWLARVGLTRPERLAEGAATGRPTRPAAPARADGRAPAGRRSAGRRGRGRRRACPDAAGTTRVRGPGQNASARRGPAHRRRPRAAPRPDPPDGRSAG